MAFDPRVAAVYNFTLAPRDPVPIVRGWNRLEGRPRLEDFERSLRAEVRDPLWFLARQWQFGEFEGEDSGSPVDARIAYSTSLFDSLGIAETITPYDPSEPLETIVEREAPPFDLLTHIQASQLFSRLLDEVSLSGRLGDHLVNFPLDYEGIPGADSLEAAALFEAGKGFLFDAASMIEAVRGGTYASVVSGFPGMTAGEAAALGSAGDALALWHQKTYGLAPSAPAWRPERLAYGFSCGASGSGIRLDALHYDGGTLDWYAFDAAPESESAPSPDPVLLSFLPTSVRFAGMPSARYWEMENSRTEFGHLDINTNDLASLLLAEFMLIYSNDWCLLPLELDVGSLTRAEGILVTDVFGERSLVRPADRGRDADWERWSMYRLFGDEAAAPGLLLAPALVASIDGPAPERVHLLRDEMANMVWAVEERVMSKLGQPFDVNRRQAASAPPPPSLDIAAYRLGTDVPENWRPFIPVHVPGSMRSIRLQRARLPNQPLKTAGEVLNVAGSYYIAEEEVPRAGRRIDRGYQRARWIDGSSWLWISRQSVTGRGEGSSGLVFDQIIEPTASKARLPDA